MRSAPVALCVLAAAAAVTSAQQPPRYVERVDVARVLVDARVLDDEGGAVSDLGAGDFEVRIGGKPARVESVQWMAGASPDEPLDSAALDLAAQGDGRVIVFVFQKSLDRSRIVGFMRMLIKARGLLDTFGPRDRVAVLSFDSHLKIWVDLTSDYDRVRRVFRRGILFEKPGPIQESAGLSLVRRLDPGRAKRTYSIEGALRRVGEALEVLPGVKSIVLVGHGFGRLSFSGVSMEGEYAAMRDALQRARASVFSLDVTEADYHTLEAGLQLVAADTGGFFARTHIFTERAVQALAGALAGHYVLFVEQPPLRRGVHAIDVELRRRKGLVLANRTYVIATQDRSDEKADPVPRPEAPTAPDAAAVAAADSIAASAVARRGLPGMSVVVLRGEEVLLANGYGAADPASRTPADAGTVYQIGSISKQFLAAAVMRLVERGTLRLDDPVRRHLPEFTTLDDRVRLHHLLSHTSGIREFFTFPEYAAGSLDPGPPVERLLALIQREPLQFAPAARWSYSNSNYTLLAAVVERVAGAPYEEVLAKELFRPLGLASLHHCSPRPSAPAHARGQVLEKDALAPSPPENLHWARGDGGLCGSAMDVARWTRALAAGRVVSPASYARMTEETPVAGGRPAAEYGFGLSLVPFEGRRKVAHNGAMVGFSGTAAHYPDAGLAIVVLVNRGAVWADAIEKEIARPLLGLPAFHLRAAALAPGEARRFAGRYDIGVFEVTVAERDGRLWLEMPPPGPTSPLVYQGDGIFVAADEPEAVRAAFSAGGGTQRLTLLMGAMHWHGTRVESEADRR